MIPTIPDHPSDGGVGVAPEAATADINHDIREMADMVPHQMWFSAPLGGIVYINNRFFEYTGADRALGVGVGWKNVVHPDDLAECIRTRDDAIKSATTWRYEYRIRRHDGEYRWHVGRTLPLFDDAGNLRRWVGTATDIHEEMMAAQRQRLFMREVLAAVTQNRLRLCDTKDDLPKSFSSLPDEKDPNAIALTPQTLRDFRRLVMQVCEQAGLPPERTADVVMAAGEAALNTVTHGGGGEGCAYADPDNGSVQVWVDDNGNGIAENLLHRATLEQGFTTAGSLGQGFPLMLRTADRVFLLTGNTGTTVVLEMDRFAPDVAFAI